MDHACRAYISLLLKSEDSYVTNYINGREVSNEDFINEKSKYVNDMEKYKLHKNTAANRKKYLK